MTPSLSPRRLALPAVAVAVAFLTGCSGTTVGGSVTLDGAPVDGGAITFIPGAGASAGLKQQSSQVVRGRYELEGKRAPQPGKYRVEIFWNKKTGKQIPVPGDPGNFTDETVTAIPPAYNQQSKLEADVKSGTNTINFDLKSQ